MSKSVQTHLHLVGVKQILGHGFDNQFEEEPGELKPGEYKGRSVGRQYFPSNQLKHENRGFTHDEEERDKP